MIESVSLVGTVDFTVFDLNGNHVRSIRDNNLVTTAGKNYLVKKIIGSADVLGSSVEVLAVGDDDSTAAAVGDTELNNEVARVDIDSVSDSGNTGQFTTTLPIGVATGTIAEAGLFTSDTTPILLSHIVLSTPFTKASDEFILVNWRIRIGSD
jgi:hypothetical protein